MVVIQSPERPNSDSIENEEKPIKKDMPTFLKKSLTNKYKETLYKVTEINVCPDCDKAVYYVSSDRKNPKAPKKWKCYYCNMWFDTPKVRPRLDSHWKPDRKHKRKKEIIQDINLITKKELVKQLAEMSTNYPKIKSRLLRNQAYIAFLYLTAARVQEVLGLRNYYTRLIVYPPILKKQISYKEIQGKDCMVIENMPVYKRKLQQGNVPLRNCVIIIEHEKELVKYIQDYIKKSVLYPNQALFWSNTPFTMKKGEASPVITYQTGIGIANLIKYPLNNMDDSTKDRQGFNHYFRHLRLSHLAKNYGFNDTLLRTYVGWADSRMAAKYTHLGVDALAGAMINSGYKPEKEN